MKIDNIQVLLVGETWIAVTRDYKGWDHFTMTTFHNGAIHFKNVLKQTSINVEQQAAHVAPSEFPSTLNELKKYDVIILSDIGANSLLLHPATLLEGKTTPNKLVLIKEYVSQGGGFIMVGGYLSFQGINGIAGYEKTPIEDILPVKISSCDDRVEVPEGFCPEIVSNKHSILRGMPFEWPILLGYNRVEMKEEGQLLLKHSNDPILVAGNYMDGRSVAWTSDIGPHWCPKEFLEWDGYKKLWKQIIQWVAG